MIRKERKTPGVCIHGCPQVDILFRSDSVNIQVDVEERGCETKEICYQLRQFKLYLIQPPSDN